MGPVLFADFADDLSRRVSRLSPMRVLETAAGTGILTRRLRDALPAAARLTATDLNPPMLATARAKFRAGEAVEFQPADAAALPFDDGGFDAVVCQFGIMFFPDKQKSHLEAHRVLAPGGRYLFSVWDAHRHNAFGRLAHDVVTGLFPVDPPQFYRVPFSYHRIDPIKDALADAGFVDLRVAVLNRIKEVPDISDFARAFVYGNPAIDQITARAGVEPAAVVSALDEALRRECGSAPMRLSLQAIVFEARRP
ncbi:MAG TPA: methyltransferase domain-containing protein [Stellaceae bacterium]|nr:methyltransferase domain-containing protein [Stellaceae bacterium]